MSDSSSMTLAWKRLDFHMQKQLQSNWCWAAAATSVDLYYDLNSPVTQCVIANTELNRTDCCGGGGAGPCNVYSYLAPPLAREGYLKRWVFNAATFGQVRTEILAERPLCLRSARPNGGAHFLAVIGYLPGSATAAGSELLAVEDPWWGSSDVPYDILRNGYHTGVWTDSLFTKTGSDA